MNSGEKIFIELNVDDTTPITTNMTLETVPPLETTQLHRIVEICAGSMDDYTDISFNNSQRTPLSSTVYFSVPKRDGQNYRNKFREVQPLIQNYLSPTGLVEVVFDNGSEQA